MASPKRQRKEPSQKKEDKVPSAATSLQFFLQGKTIADIAKERVLGTSTIEGHLSNYIKTGEITVDSFVNESSLKIITECINSYPDKTHGEIRMLLNNAYSYIQIRAVANHLFWLQHTATSGTF